MHFFHKKIKSLRIEWNERPFDDEDVGKLCRRFRVTLTEMPLRVGGFYYRVMGRDHIAVNSQLHGKERLAVIFHELGHFLFHAPESGATANFHGVGRRTRKEIEADIFALCALIPTSMLGTVNAAELADDGFTDEMISERFAIYERYGL